MSGAARRSLVAVVLALAAIASATPSGQAWKNPSSVTYKVFQHSGGISGVPDFAQVLPRVQNGFRRWTSAAVPCTRWQSFYAGAFTSPAGRFAINAQDGQNLVIWLGGTEWTHDDATLGLTTVTYMSGTGEIVDADMELNNNRQWKVGGQALAVDVESILTHETGHFLGLAHSPTVSAVMYANYPIGEVKVDLTSVDINDVCTVYPSLADGGTLGAFCASDLSCSSGTPYCRGLASTDGGSRICTTLCSGTTASCPATGYACQAASPDGGYACLLQPGSRDLCRFCTSGSECSTGYCVADDSLRHNWCTVTCRRAADCGLGYDCVDAGTTGLCTPSGSPIRCPARQCTSAADCAPGYACNAQGMCEATGQTGDRCEVTAYCAGCSTCAGTVQEAYCRSCCGSTGPGGLCSACTNPPCGSGLGCTQLSNLIDSVCLPLTGNSCQTCSATSPCASGLQCISGRCHPPCNLDHPGNCGACFPVGTNAAFCACADEVAYPGQSCTSSTGGLLVCTNGHACVGTPKKCQPTCTLGDNSTCANGATCTLVDGQAVCTGSGSSPGARCGPSSTGTCGAGACGTGLSCYGGRCYEPCDPANPTCPGRCTVVTPGTLAVCACDDQRAAIGQACGVTPTTVAVCSPGAECVTGICRQACDPTNPICYSGQSCQQVESKWVCAPAPPDAGQPDAGTDAGTGGGVVSGGCGCTAGSGWMTSLAALAALVALAQRRRRG